MVAMRLPFGEEDCRLGWCPITVALMTKALQ